MEYVIGIDEAGRGAIAGPVSVGAVLVPLDFDWREVFRIIAKKRQRPKLRDSKQLSPQQRAVLYEYIAAHGRLRHAVALVGADAIDAIGIVNAAHEAAVLALKELGASPERARILLDAGLRVPDQWNQESFVRGDETIPAISFASIMAKVTRDRFMERLSEKYAAYNFAQHKGYGTLAHRKAIARTGFCDIHRTTFCTRIFGVEPDPEVVAALAEGEAL